jgi:hypothetical protein
MAKIPMVTKKNALMVVASSSRAEDALLLGRGLG